MPLRNTDMFSDWCKSRWLVEVFEGWVNHAFNVFRQHILPWTTDTQPIESNADLGQGLLGFANHSVWKITSSSSTSAWSGIRSGGWEQLYLTISGSSLVKKKKWSLVRFCWSKPDCKCFFWCLLEGLFPTNQTQKIFKPTMNAFRKMNIAYRPLKLESASTLHPQINGWRCGLITVHFHDATDLALRSA